jgi:hypothetical protein
MPRPDADAASSPALKSSASSAARKPAERSAGPDSLLGKRVPVYVATGNAFAAVAAAQDSISPPTRTGSSWSSSERRLATPSPRWVEIEETLNAELEQAVYGTKSPVEALSAADARIAEILARSP